MKSEFYKMNGAGNDFILIDNRSAHLSLSKEHVAKLCHRQRGIGADGLILLENSKTVGADFLWQFYNSDGSLAEMCGNGSRCFAKFIQKVTDAQEDVVTFQTISGIITAQFIGDTQVKVTLTEPTGLELNATLEWADQTGFVHSLNTGVPHAVYFVEDIEKIPVKNWGNALRFHKHFAPKGTNVNFVEVMKDAQGRPLAEIKVRTYERGVEDETLACGTGVTASALLTAKVFGLSSPLAVHTRGGDILKVGFSLKDTQFKDVTLTGPAEFVFKGEIEI